MKIITVRQIRVCIVSHSWPLYVCGDRKYLKSLSTSPVYNSLLKGRAWAVGLVNMRGTQGNKWPRWKWATATRTVKESVWQRWNSKPGRRHEVSKSSEEPRQPLKQKLPIHVGRTSYKHHLSIKKPMDNELRQEMGGGALVGWERILGNSELRGRPLQCCRGDAVAELRGEERGDLSQMWRHETEERWLTKWRGKNSLKG